MAHAEAVGVLRESKVEAKDRLLAAAWMDELCETTGLPRPDDLSDALVASRENVEDAEAWEAWARRYASWPREPHEAE